MDSDDDYYDDGDLYDDSGNESPEVEDGSEEEENFIMDAGFEDEPSGSSSQKIEEEYHFEVDINIPRYKSPIQSFAGPMKKKLSFDLKLEENLEKRF